MEEQSKNPGGQETEESTSKGNVPQKNTTPTRSYVLMILAGAYLIYTGYRLCKNVIDGVDGGSWGFFAAGIAFLIVGAVMLFIGGKNFIERDKENRLQREEEEKEQAAAEPEPAEEKKSMSIAERANLAATLAEENAEQGQEAPETVDQTEE